MRLFVLLTALLMLLSGQSVAQGTGITIITPVTGDFAAIALEDVVIFNSQSGALTMVEGTANPLGTLPIIWNGNGSKLVFTDTRSVITVFDTLSQQLTRETLAVSNSFYENIGWSNDGDELISLGISEQIQPNVRTATFYKYFLADNSVLPLASYTTNSETSAIPNLQGTIPYNLEELYEFTRNPVFDDWVMGDYRSQDQVPNVIVQNFATGQMIQLSPMFGNAQIVSNFQWSNNGKSILLLTFDRAINEYSVKILKFDEDGSILIDASTSDTESHVIIDWLGVGDLFITISTTSTGNHTYFINQIINDVLYEQPFLLLDTDVIYFSSVDFYLRADDEEKHQLSCLFDQALPTQLAISARARVNFTDGTPLRLRDAPSLDANEIMQMPEGTEFDIIGGKACVNADSYTRFWEVLLDDGTAGWAAEANLTDYFMEPVD